MTLREIILLVAVLPLFVMFTAWSWAIYGAGWSAWAGLGLGLGLQCALSYLLFRWVFRAGGGTSTPPVRHRDRT